MPSTTRTVAAQVLGVRVVIEGLETLLATGGADDIPQLRSVAQRLVAAALA